MSYPTNLPFGWISQFDSSSGRNFYVNTATGISYWHLPLQSQEQHIHNHNHNHNHNQQHNQTHNHNETRNETYDENPADSDELPAYEQVAFNHQEEEPIDINSLVSCPICERKVKFGIINQHLEANCKSTETLVDYRKNQGHVQVPYGQSQSYSQTQSSPYGQGQGSYRQSQQYQQPYQQSSSRPNRRNQGNGMGGAGLGLALGGGLLGGFLLGDMLGGGF